MKTKTLIMVCLLIGIGLTQLSAQNSNSGGTKSISWYYTDLGWYTGVYCDGVMIDYITGSGDAHVIDHYKNWVWLWETISFSGTGKSLWTGEAFTFSELDKIYLPKEGATTCTTHVKGDKCALYNLYFVFYDDGTTIVKQAICTGNTK